MTDVVITAKLIQNGILKQEMITIASSFPYVPQQLVLTAIPLLIQEITCRQVTNDSCNIHEFAQSLLKLSTLVTISSTSCTSDFHCLNIHSESSISFCQFCIIVYMHFPLLFLSSASGQSLHSLAPPTH